LYLNYLIDFFPPLFILPSMYNVLIADDDVDAWFQLNALLRRYLIKANFVTNFNAAKQYIDRHLPSLLFFDNHLQNHSTIDLIRYVKSKYPYAKIVMINTHAERPNHPALQPDLTISKPLMPDIIEYAIVKLLHGVNELHPELSR